MSYGPKPKPAHERVLSRIERADDCWLYDGHCDPHGYGIVRVRHEDGRRGTARAHRLVYEALIGPVGDLELHHDCGNPACVNPDHLMPLTRSEHIAQHEIVDARGFGTLRQCLNCGSLFTVKKPSVGKRWCSTSCYANQRWAERRASGITGRLGSEE